MLRIANLKLPLDAGPDAPLLLALKKLRVPREQVVSWHVSKKSVDARDKGDVHFVVAVDVALKSESAVLHSLRPGIAVQAPTPSAPPRLIAPPRGMRPVIAGFGPGGLFAALTLARAGAEPILLEQGDSVEERERAVRRFVLTGELDERSNIQFGEGGAGAFSDGKLSTGTHDVRGRQVLHDLAAAGAPEEILWEARPHIGTDRLPATVRGLRQEIQRLGGEVRFRTALTDVLLRDGALRGVETSGGVIETDTLILCTGHSARELFATLYARGARMEQKPFSIGVRAEHPQSLIDRAQYGDFAGHPELGAADYKLSVHLPNGRGVYTFCMCPGGQVAAASSEAGRLCVNGMSPFARDGRNANSAVLVNVLPSDFPDSHPLSGVAFQRQWEEAAYRCGGGNYRAPVQRLEDFLLRRPSTGPGSVRPTYPRGVRWGDVSECLPGFAADSLRQAFPLFDRKLRGFALPDTVLTAVESRSSSPVRILRDESGQSNLRGVFPCGEGAGYAGGILSAAVDGIRQAEKAMARWM